MRYLKHSTSVLALFLLSIYLGCSPTGPDVAGDGSQTGNAAVVGVLYNPDGTPAKNAKVYFITYNHQPTLKKALAKTLATMAVGDSTTTDSTGTFSFDSMSADTYNVFGEGPDGNLSYQDSVVITGNTANPDTVPPDTVKLPGSLAGFLKMEPGDDPRTVTMYVIGATKYALPESDASFSLAEMAEGTYRVRILSTLDKYLPLDTTLTIDAGTELNLPDSIVLPLKIPKITDFTVNYDTLKQIVTLSWDQADKSRITGYNVYRKHVDSTAVKLNVQALTDTFYVDSTGVQDETYIYSVVGVDLNGDEGIKVSGDSVAILSAFEFSQTVVSTGSNDGQVLQPIGIDIDAHGNLYVADGGNSRVQKFDSTGQFLLNFGEYGSLDSQFIGPVDLAVDSAGYIYVLDEMTLKKFDTAGVFDTSWAIKGNAQAIAISSEQSIYVATSHTQSYVQVFSPLGDSIGEWSLPDGGKGIDVAPNGQIFVSTIDGTVGVYSSDGTLTDSWTVQNAQQGCRLAVSDSLFYAAIGYNLDYITIIDFAGNQIARFGSGGPNALEYPKDLTILGEKIFITDNNGIQLYTRP
ncbi:MAG: hypothetical protein JXB18_11425 [Sedimentisphaerales bacterium]|nr:hypothetical protein [Sedimentisphaerales bacterium]